MIFKRKTTGGLCHCVASCCPKVPTSTSPYFFGNVSCICGDSIVIQHDTVMDHNSCYKPHGSGCPTGPLPLSKPHACGVGKIKVQLAVAMRCSNSQDVTDRHQTLLCCTNVSMYSVTQTITLVITSHTQHMMPETSDRYGYQAQTQSCTYYAPTGSQSDYLHLNQPAR